MKSDLLNRTRKMLRTNSPQLLAGLGIIGVVGTGVLAAKGAFDSAKAIKDADAEDANLKDKVKLTWVNYIPAASVGAITIGCITGSTRLHGKRAAAALGAYTITEQAFSEYRNKVREELGAHKEQVLRDDIVREHIADNPAKGIIIAGDGNVLCCELYTGRYFMSSMENLRQAMNSTNQSVVNNYYVSLNEFYDLIGLPHTATSSELGWDSDRLLELEFSTVLSEDGKPCLAFNYNYIKPI